MTELHTTNQTAKLSENAAMRSALRSHTRALHDRLDQHGALVALGSAGPRRAIVQAIAALRLGLAPVEAALVAHSSVGAHPRSWLQPPLAERLAADLRALGEPLEPLREVPMDGVPCSPAGWLGVAWVLAGSRHGAAALAGPLTRAVGTALASFSRWSTPDRKRWQWLLAELESLGGPSSAAGQRAIRGAIWAFTAIMEGLE